MSGIVHIVIAMKPCEGNFVGNALKNNVAGLNIDGCRIGTAEVLKGGSGGLLSHVRDDKPYSDENGYKPSKQGRWPANVILGHSDGCKCVGMKKVRGSLIEKPCPNPEIKGHKWGTMQGNRGTRGYGDAAGTESIDNWECVEGCPVKAIDEQSGISGSNWRPNKANGSTSIWGSGEYKKNETVDDAGGASRFFKQIKEVTDET
jgi:hypothetical protein